LGLKIRRGLRKYNSIASFLAKLACLIIVFFIGWLVGSGRISFDKLSNVNKNLPNQLNFSSANQVYQYIKNDYDGTLTTNQILDGINQGLASSTNDPYTEYFNKTQAAAFNNEINGSFTGVGAQLGENNSNELIVIAPIAGTPAAKAGLQPQDIIAAINGQSTSGLTVDTAVTDIRGPSGSKVTLTIDRGNTVLNIKITRAQITIPSVTWKILPGNIGYMQVAQYGDDTSSLAQQAAQQFKSDKVKGVILDLRNDPGGLVTAAVNVSSLWLPQGQLIMQEKRGSEVLQTYTSTGNDILQGLPTVVLINDGSASASEITAGALHDHGVAYIIGTTSFGKGSVQELDNLSNGGELKVTIAHWYRPDGKNINHIGITPDQTVQLSTAQLAAGNDTQQNAAISYINSH
jgi:carboxyl-terminal processing protease